MKKSKLEVGDVIELSSSAGLIYLHYLGREPGLGDAVMVRPKALRERPALTPSLFEGGYVIFFPLTHALRAGLVVVVGRLPSAGMPDCYRQPRQFDKAGRVSAWLISTPSGQVVKTTLTREERNYTRRSVWNDTHLIERVSEGWTPDREEELTDAAQETVEASVDGQKRVQHYFYFSRRSQAHLAADQLREMGLATSIQRSATDDKWLVLGIGDLTAFGGKQANLRDALERLAGRYDGEYDGWEAAL